MNVFFREPRPEFSGWLRQASFPADPALQGSARIGRRIRRWISPGVILETAARRSLACYRELCSSWLIPTCLLRWPESQGNHPGGNPPDSISFHSSLSQVIDRLEGQVKTT